MRELGLKYVVITSVTRDDLPDGGAGHFADMIRAVRDISPETRIEVLIPDFGGNKEALDSVIAEHPEVIGHNIETVERFYPEIRRGADYTRSLKILKHVSLSDSGILAKSGIMLGMGESSDEISDVLSDLLEAGCAIITMGQYLRPREDCVPVERFIPPDEFSAWENTAREMGFREAFCGPFVRSSYHADEVYSHAKI